MSVKKTYLKIYKLLLKTKKRKVLKNYLHINLIFNVRIKHSCCMCPQ